MNECPKCQAEFHTGDAECPKCGVIFAKFEKYQAKLKAANIAPADDPQDARAEIPEDDHIWSSDQHVPKKEKPSLIVVVGGGFIVVCVLFAIYAQLTMPKIKPRDHQRNTPITREEQIQTSFSGWDGSHKKLTELIKESMNDPDSFQHDNTVYWDMKDHIRVKTTFRGKNAFGGVVKNTVFAKADLQGNIIEIIAQE